MTTRVNTARGAWLTHCTTGIRPVPSAPAEAGRESPSSRNLWLDLTPTVAIAAAGRSRLLPSFSS